MNIFVTGATGFIGGTVAEALRAAGHRIRGLTRSDDKAGFLRSHGIEPAVGSLDDSDLLQREARAADAVVNAADSDHRGAVEAFVAALAGSGKAFLHTSGSSVVADDARGSFASDNVFDEETRFEPTPHRAARVAIDRFVVAATERGIRSVVLCNTLIYGTGRGVHADSVQIPRLIAQAKKSGIVRHVGDGRNIWSTVHIDDVATLYRLALDRAPGGAYYFVENGEASFRQITAAIARRLGLGPPQAWPALDAIEEWGYGLAVYALGSNSRVRGKRARAELGWAPVHGSVTEWIEREA